MFVKRKRIFISFPKKLVFSVSINKLAEPLHGVGGARKPFIKSLLTCKKQVQDKFWNSFALTLPSVLYRSKQFQFHAANHSIILSKPAIVICRDCLPSWVKMYSSESFCRSKKKKEKREIHFETWLFSVSASLYKSLSHCQLD